MKNNKEITKRIITGVLATNISILSSGCNMGLVDTKYGQNTALIVGDDTAITFDIDEWKDYEGEQYQIRTKDGLILLTSSFDTDLFFGEGSNYTPDNIAKNAISENGEVYKNSTDINHSFNYDIIDTHWKYNKAVLFNKNNALIFNIASWRDYEGEQLQIVTDEGMVILLSSYNSKLFYDKQSTTKARDFASMYVGSDGVVSEIGNDVDNDKFMNYSILDLKYNFNKVIIFKDNKSIILPIEKWRDYEGEQLQIKIVDGPTIVTAAYDSILLDDKNSSTKAYDVASKITSEVIDLTDGKTQETTFNKQIFDFVYSFSTGVISNNNSASSITVSKWCDYEGEQLQVILPNGDVMLTSSIFLDLINDGTNELNANTLAEYYSNDKTIQNATTLTDHISFNKQVFDLEMKYNYALHIENGNVTIIPLKRWRDYYNSNGTKSAQRRENPDGTYHVVVTTDEDSPNCEQLQLELPDDTVILTSAYDTILLKTNNIEDYAELFRGSDGVITNLTPVFGEPNIENGWNFRLFDTKYRFNYGVYNNGINSQIFEIQKWMDFADGEQVQLYFNDGNGMVSSYPNVSLIYTENEEKVEAIAHAFAGQELGKGRVYKYNN